MAVSIIDVLGVSSEVRIGRQGTGPHQVHGRGSCLFQGRISIREGAGGTPLNADRLATAEVADEGQTGFQMQGDHAEGTGLQALRTAIAFFSPQKDGGGRVISVQGLGCTGSNTWCLAAQTTYVGAVHPQRFVLDDAQTRRVDAEEAIVSGDTGYLAGATTATEFVLNDQPAHGHEILA